uniref:G domain-containing protein n=1 Tax=Rhabditophanes sp. KR3021 TaxID=114890 RepID=A0AC35UD74_9BILA
MPFCCSKKQKTPNLRRTKGKNTHKVHIQPIRYNSLSVEERKRADNAITDIVAHNDPVPNITSSYMEYEYSGDVDGDDYTPKPLDVITKETELVAFHSNALEEAIHTGEDIPVLKEKLIKHASFKDDHYVRNGYHSSSINYTASGEGQIPNKAVPPVNYLDLIFKNNEVEHDKRVSDSKKNHDSEKRGSLFGKLIGSGEQEEPKDMHNKERRPSLLEKFFKHDKSKQHFDFNQGKSNILHFTMKEQELDQTEFVPTYEKRDVQARILHDLSEKRREERRASMIAEEPTQRRGSLIDVLFNRNKHDEQDHKDTEQDPHKDGTDYVGKKNVTEHEKDSKARRGSLLDTVLGVFGKGHKDDHEKSKEEEHPKEERQKQVIKEVRHSTTNEVQNTPNNYVFHDAEKNVSRVVVNCDTSGLEFSNLPSYQQTTMPLHYDLTTSSAPLHDIKHNHKQVGLIPKDITRNSGDNNPTKLTRDENAHKTIISVDDSQQFNSKDKKIHTETDYEKLNSRSVLHYTDNRVNDKADGVQIGARIKNNKLEKVDSQAKSEECKICKAACKQCNDQVPKKTKHRQEYTKTVIKNEKSTNDGAKCDSYVKEQFQTPVKESDKLFLSEGKISKVNHANDKASKKNPKDDNYVQNLHTRLNHNIVDTYKNNAEEVIRDNLDGKKAFESKVVNHTSVDKKNVVRSEGMKTPRHDDSTKDLNYQIFAANYKHFSDTSIHQLKNGAHFLTHDNSLMLFKPFVSEHNVCPLTGLNILKVGGQQGSTLDDRTIVLFGPSNSDIKNQNLPVEVCDKDFGAKKDICKECLFPHTNSYTSLLDLEDKYYPFTATEHIRIDNLNKSELAEKVEELLRFTEQIIGYGQSERLFNSLEMARFESYEHLRNKFYAESIYENREIEVGKILIKDRNEILEKEIMDGTEKNHFGNLNHGAIEHSVEHSHETKITEDHKHEEIEHHHTHVHQGNNDHPHDHKEMNIEHHGNLSHHHLDNNKAVYHLENMHHTSEHNISHFDYLANHNLDQMQNESHNFEQMEIKNHKLDHPIHHNHNLEHSEHHHNHNLDQFQGKNHNSENSIHNLKQNHDENYTVDNHSHNTHHHIEHKLHLAKEMEPHYLHHAKHAEIHLHKLKHDDGFTLHQAKKHSHHEHIGNNHGSKTHNLHHHRAISNGNLTNTSQQHHEDTHIRQLKDQSKYPNTIYNRFKNRRSLSVSSSSSVESRIYGHQLRIIRSGKIEDLVFDPSLLRNTQVENNNSHHGSLKSQQHELEHDLENHIETVFSKNASEYNETSLPSKKESLVSKIVESFSVEDNHRNLYQGSQRQSVVSNTSTLKNGNKDVGHAKHSESNDGLEHSRYEHSHNDHSSETFLTELSTKKHSIASMLSNDNIPASATHYEDIQNDHNHSISNDDSNHSISNSSDDTVIERPIPYDTFENKNVAAVHEPYTAQHNHMKSINVKKSTFEKAESDSSHGHKEEQFQLEGLVKDKITKIEHSQEKPLTSNAAEIININTSELIKHFDQKNDKTPTTHYSRSLASNDLQSRRASEASFHLSTEYNSAALEELENELKAYELSRHSVKDRIANGQIDFLNKEGINFLIKSKVGRPRNQSRKSIVSIGSSVSYGYPTRVHNISSEIEISQITAAQIQSSKTESHRYQGYLMIKPNCRETVCKYTNIKKVIIGGERSSKKHQKRIILFGPTNSGKTSLINSICNQLYDVGIENNFRFYINDPEHLSHTTEITAYQFNNINLGYSVTVVDTPGISENPNKSGFNYNVLYQDYLKKYIARHGSLLVHGICIVARNEENLCSSKMYKQICGLRRIFDGYENKLLYPVITDSIPFAKLKFLDQEENEHHRRALWYDHSFKWTSNSYIAQLKGDVKMNILSNVFKFNETEAQMERFWTLLELEALPVLLKRKT